MRNRILLVVMLASSYLSAGNFNAYCKDQCTNLDKKTLAKRTPSKETRVQAAEALQCCQKSCTEWELGNRFVSCDDVYCPICGKNTKGKMVATCDNKTLKHVMHATCLDKLCTRSIDKKIASCTTEGCTIKCPVRGCTNRIPCLGKDRTEQADRAHKALEHKTTKRGTHAKKVSPQPKTPQAGPVDLVAQ